jgi:hypothetical protein
LWLFFPDAITQKPGRGAFRVFCWEKKEGETPSFALSLGQVFMGALMPTGRIFCTGVVALFALRVNAQQHRPTDSECCQRQ